MTNNDRKDLEKSVSSEKESMFSTDFYHVESSSELRQIGPYKLLQKLGEGGMGTVWMAEQQTPVRRRVALKLIKNDMVDSHVVARFEAERQALAMMDHQNIARVLDAGAEDGTPYVVMELVQGIPITEYCDRNKLTLRERLELFIPVCKAVQHAHQKGIIHRDLKPSNILICIYGGEPTSKIIDFGLAKATQQHIRLTEKTLFTEFGKVVGTLQYMSPEQAVLDALDADTRTDIYSLGVILFELMAGSTPLDQATIKHNALLRVLEIIRDTDPPRASFRVSSSAETIQTIGEQRRLQPAKLQQVLRGDLDWIIMRALDRDRTRRYPTANNFAEDILRYLAGEAIEARPPSTVYAISKFISKYRGLVATASTIAAMLIAAVVGISLFAIRAELANKESQRQKDRANSLATVAQDKERLAAKAVANAKVAEVAALADRRRAEAALARSYVAHASTRWDANRAGNARELLERVPAEHRDYEWYLWRREFQGSDLTLYGGKQINSICYSPDGSKFASGSGFQGCGDKSCSGCGGGNGDWTIRIWDSVTGSELKVLKGHDGAVQSVCFSPNGKWLASGSRDNSIKLWDLSNGTVIQTFSSDGTHINSVCFSPDGQLIAAGLNGKLRIWNAETGVVARTLEATVSDERQRQSTVTSVRFSPDGTKIAAGCSRSQDGEAQTIWLWDVSTGRSLKTFTGHTEWVSCIDVSLDGTKLVAAYPNARSVVVWNLLEGSRVNTFKGHLGPIRSVSFSPSGRTVASAGEDRVVRVWDAKNATELFAFKGHETEISSVRFAPNGQRIASAGNSIRVWDARSGETAEFLRGDDTSGVSFDEQGKTVVIGGRSIRIWDVLSGEGYREFLEDGYVYDVKLSLDGTTLVSTSGRILRMRNARTGESIWTADHGEIATRIDLSSDASVVASFSKSSVKLWRGDSGELLTSHRVKVDEWLESACVSPEGWLVLGISKVERREESTKVLARSIKRWDWSANSLTTLQDQAAAISALSISPDGKHIASAGATSSIQLWDAQTGKGIRVLDGHQGWITSLCFHSDSSRLLSTGYDNTTKLWDIETGEELMSFSNKSRRGTSRFSPEGSEIAMLTIDGIKLLNVPRSSEFRTLRGHKFPVQHAFFSADGARVISRSVHESLAWHAGAGKLIGNAPIDVEMAGSDRSPNGRWLSVPAGKRVLLVDLEFKNTPREKAYRQFKARLDPIWHEQQAETAEADGDWFAAMFHRAWIAKSKPKEQENYEQLGRSYQSWLDANSPSARNSASPPTTHLPSVVREMLSLDVR